MGGRTEPLRPEGGFGEVALGALRKLPHVEKLGCLAFTFKTNTRIRLDRLQPSPVNIGGHNLEIRIH